MSFYLSTEAYVLLFSPHFEMIQILVLSVATSQIKTISCKYMYVCIYMVSAVMYAYMYI